MAGTRSVYFDDETELLIKMYMEKHRHIRTFSNAVRLMVKNSQRSKNTEEMDVKIWMMEKEIKELRELANKPLVEE